MATKIGEVFWKISGDTKDIDKSVKSTETKMGKFANAVKGAFAIGAVIAFGKAVFEIGKALVLVASDAEETAQKFGVVFDGINSASDAAANLAEGYGLSNQASQDLLSSTADLLQGFGVAKDESLELSLKTQQLAVDLASFSNFAGGAKGASEALTKALLGERESVKALGIAITEAELKRFAEEGGQVYSEMTKAEKAVLTLDLAIQQSANSIGDFQRSEASFANQTRIATANIEDLQAALGEKLLPAATELVTTFNELIGGVQTFVTDGNFEKVIKGFRILTDVTMAAINPLGAVIKSLRALKLIEEEQDLQELGSVWVGNMDNLAESTNTAGVGFGLLVDESEALIESLDDLADAEERVNGGRKGDIKGDLEQSIEAEAAKRAARKANLEADVAETLAANIAVLDSERERVAVIEELQEEARLNQIARDQEIIDKEQERHDARMAHLLDELDSASSYAGDAGTIFNNLIKLQMAGDDELTDSKKRGIIALYRLQQSANIAQIGINTATAVVRALADLGPIAGAIASGFIIGIGATQAAVVAATPPPVALADGGIVPARPGGTSAILGEAGQAEAVIPLDSAGIGGGGDTVLMIDGEILARWTQSQINNRAIVVPEGSMV